eukprot:sb/3464522/
MLSYRAIYTLTIPHNIPSSSEYPSELEMSPGSSVVTSYVDVTGGGGGTGFDKQHIRSASGTVYNQDIDEILKQVTLPTQGEASSSSAMDLESTLPASRHHVMLARSNISDSSSSLNTQQSTPTPTSESPNQQQDALDELRKQSGIPALNSRQNAMLLSLKKQRQELRETKTETSNSSEGDVDDLPMNELLGAPSNPSEYSANKTRKRPRLEGIDLQNPPEDYLSVLAKFGLPKKNNPNSMAITIYYKTVGVSAYGISNPVGARLYYCPVRVQMTDEMSNELYGPQAATQICMPLCLNSTPKATQTLLGTLTRGVVLQEDQGDIFATRLCQCAVFFGDKRGFLTKLERGQRVKIFDFKSRFLPLFFQYLKVQSEGDQKVLLDPFPEPDVMLSFGQRWGDKRPIENTLIWAKVIHLKARQLVLDFTQLFPPLSSSTNDDCIQFSKSDDYDRLADAFSVAM